MMRISNAILKLHNQYIFVAFNVSVSSILQIVSVMLILLLAYEYAVEY